MNAIKNISALIFILIGITNCNTQPKKYFIDPIDKWMKSNLNDYNSYEPVEFQVLEYINEIPLLKYNNSGYTHILKREVSALSELISELKKVKEIDTTIINRISQIHFELSGYSLLKSQDIQRVSELNQELYSLFREPIFTKATSENQKILETEAQIEGTMNRLKLQGEKLYKINEISIPNLDKVLKNGCIINHKFRSKNSFNATVIQEVIFVLDSDREEVKYIVEM